MKTYKLASLIVACLFLAVIYPIAAATNAAPSPEVKKAVESQVFRAGEWQIDALYQARTDDLKNFEHGGGLRAAYFPWRAAGFGLEGRTEDVSSALFDRIGLSLIGRFPVEKIRLAPEIRVGFDYDIEDSLERAESKRRTGFDVFASIGAELRIQKNVGIFAEVRGVKPVEAGSREHLLGLTGVRFNF